MMRTWVLVEGGGQLITAVSSIEQDENMGWFRIDGAQALWVAPGDTISATMEDTENGEVLFYNVVPVNETLLERLVAALARKRWEESTIGIRYKNNVFSTDAETRSLIESRRNELSGVAEDTTRTLAWKSETGFIDLTLVDFSNIAQAIALHTQHVFDTEDAILKAMNEKEALADKLDVFNTEVNNTDWGMFNRYGMDYNRFLTAPRYYNTNKTPPRLGALSFRLFDASDDDRKAAGFVPYTPPEHNRAYDAVETEIEEIDGEWVVDYTIVPGDTEAAANYAKQRVADKGWQVQNGGLFIPGIPFKIPTDENAQAKIGQMAASYQDGDLEEDETVQYSVGTYAIELNREQALGLKRAVVRHVQGAYSRRGALTTAINDLAKTGNAHDIRDFMEAEFDKGWPSNDAPPASTPTPTPPTETGN